MNHRTLRLVRMGIDTHRQPVVFMRADCDVCRSEGFEALARVEVRVGDRSIVATLQVVTSDLLARHEAGLSDDAWRRLGVREGDRGTMNHPPPLESFRHVRAKMYGARLDEGAFAEIVGDIGLGRWPDVHGSRGGARSSRTSTASGGCPATGRRRSSSRSPPRTG